MLHLGVSHQVPDRLHNDRNACLVVRTEKGCAVAADYCFAEVRLERREFVGAKRATFRKSNISAVVIFGDDCLYVLAAYRAAGVHMGNKAKFVTAVVAVVCRQFGIHVAVFVVHCYLNARFGKLIGKQTQQIFLLFTTGKLFYVGYRLGVDCRVTQKSVK